MTFDVRAIGTIKFIADEPALHAPQIRQSGVGPKAHCFTWATEQAQHPRVAYSRTWLATYARPACSYLMLRVRVKGPFDLRLSLAAAASFLPIAESPPILTALLDVDGKTATVTISQPARRLPVVHVSATSRIDKPSLERFTKWLVWSELDLLPFYRLLAEHPIMGAVASSLTGLKPLRPATLFEMAIIAISEQQLSLAAAFHIRARLVRRFGKRVGSFWRFPSAERLAATPVRDLASCGLSGRKAQYVKELAERVNEGILDFETLKEQSDDRIREQLLAVRGFGEWSVQYMLARGFGRPDALPSSDVGLRRVVGHYFARGRRLTPAQLERALAPFKPFRSLAAYYLAVHWRLRGALKHMPPLLLGVPRQNAR